jgi:hypothetical protein
MREGNKGAKRQVFKMSLRVVDGFILKLNQCRKEYTALVKKNAKTIS